MAYVFALIVFLVSAYNRWRTPDDETVVRLFWSAGMIAAIVIVVSAGIFDGYFAALQTVTGP